MRLFAAILILIVIYVVQKKLFSLNWAKSLDVSLSFSKSYLSCGEKVYLYERITNDKLLPLPVFHLKFSAPRSFKFDEMDNSVVTDYYHRTDVFSIMGHQRVERKLGFTGTKRGVFSIPAANIMVKDFFLLSSFAKSIKVESILYVFPDKRRTDNYLNLYSGILGDIRSKRRYMADESLFRGIRDYLSSDRKRDINWKQSSRGTGLKSNIYDYSQSIKIKIMLNLDTESMLKAEDMIEVSISLASSVAEDLLKLGLDVSLVSNGTDISGQDMGTVGYGADMSHSLVIDRYLAGISGSRYYEEFLRLLDTEKKYTEENVYYIIISSYHKEEMLRKIDTLLERGSGVSLIVPYYNTLGINAKRDYIRGWEVDYYES